MDKHNRRYESQQKINQQKNFDLQQEQFLNLKRKKLSNLFNSEEIKYRNEIINGQETAEDVKRRMEKELMELRKERMSQEDNDIQKLNNKRF
jgi:adenylosuccinate synthase